MPPDKRQIKLLDQGWDILRHSFHSLLPRPRNRFEFQSDLGGHRWNPGFEYS